MLSYVALIFPKGDARRASLLAGKILSRTPYLSVSRGAGTFLLLTADPPRRLRAARGGEVQVVGEVYARGSLNPPDLPRDAECTPGRLLREIWGRYVAFGGPPNTDEQFVLRDPSGALEAYILQRTGILVVASHAPGWLVRLVDPAAGIDFTMLANALAHPLLAVHRSLLHRVTRLPAGGALAWNGSVGRISQPWCPALQAHCEPQRNGSHLRDAVLLSCAAVRARHSRLIVELSGGLDSAIVLGALVQSGGAAGITCVNFATRARAGDERPYARAAAAMCGVELVEVAAHERSVDYSFIAGLDQGPSPSLYGFDPILERTVSDLVCTSGSTACLTGQGGDAVFYQYPSLLPALDLLQADGVAALGSSQVVEIARRANTTVWDVWWRMLRHCVGCSAWGASSFERSMLGPAAVERLLPSLHVHPWLARAAELPPGKQEQLAALANCQLFNDPTLRSRVTQLCHPLLAQPVMAAALGVPTYRLASGLLDRALARQVFADLVPSAILERQGKGETSDYHYRALARNLPFLRDWLINGRLAAHRLLDRDALLAALDPDVLLHSARPGIALTYASIEAWARAWGL